MSIVVATIGMCDFFEVNKCVEIHADGDVKDASDDED